MQILARNFGFPWLKLARTHCDENGIRITMTPNKNDLVYLSTICEMIADNMTHTHVLSIKLSSKQTNKKSQLFHYGLIICLASVFRCIFSFSILSYSIRISERLLMSWCENKNIWQRKQTRERQTQTEFEYRLWNSKQTKHLRIEKEMPQQF